MAVAVITEQEIRQFMMDRPESNTLINGVRFKTEDIDRACINVVDAFNCMPPSNGVMYAVEQFPYRYLLLTGVVGYLLRGAAVSEASNALNYSSDGVQVADRDKAAAFTELGNAFWQEFRQMTKDIKLTQNINSLLGSVGSEYGWRR